MLQKIANSVRVLSADTVEYAGSGHAGMPLGCAEIGAYLFAREMKYNPDEPEWFNRDRLVLSAGHGSIWLYSLLHLTGYDLSLEDLKQYRKFESKTPGHPEYGITPGVEMTTGPLGQGLAHSVGMALAEEILADKFNKENYNLIDHYTYVVAGDGDLMEGVSYEAVSLAGNLGLDKLIVIYDHNGVSIDGPTDITFDEDIEKRFSAANWQVISPVDGNDFLDLEYAFNKAKADQKRPTLIIADTKIAKGITAKEGQSSAHASPLGREEILEMKRKADFPEAEFKVPEEVYQYFKEHKQKLAANFADWEELKDQYVNKFEQEYRELQAGINLKSELDFAGSSINFEEKMPPRNYSGEYYRYLADQIPYLIGGTADLSASTRINLDQYSDIQKENFSGRNIKFGIREHAMAAAAGGIMLHQGLRPVIATYLTFSDYMRPSIRMAAIMGLPVIYVFTHDSIYVGQDGPTHQPVEQLESLRMIPGLRVIRPANGREVKLAWEAAVKENKKPVALVMARQAVDSYSKEISSLEFERGAFIVSDTAEADIAIMAAGSEVETALKVKNLLKGDYKVRIISTPEKEKLHQNQKYLEQLFGNAKLTVAIEAGNPTGWYRVMKGNSLVFGVEDFGFSAPGEKIAEEFGLTAENIAKEIKNNI
ncbi:transketolase [Halanaerobium saccharolyticum]|uniref:Transketolase n=1 Tax=Halanaerobium saccharolyticum TaxID=43595 RepID=A0A4R7YV24_9FIRM|nr:transketolase [Halanaerobium saccharolyticum]RAK06945.1 transketolase [Halanaerobium saccharolyticum]TDW01672.1 transketolase [Halanaerobium saccharolyticum]TDX53070.1 transketolase [Halanaerobium saccharolyticum]